MGGRVALEVLRAAPGRVERLALLDTGYRSRPDGTPGEDERARRYALLALAREHGMRAMGREWMRAMVHPTRLADATLVDAILDMIARQTPDRYAGQIDALLARPDVTSLLRRSTFRPRRVRAPGRLEPARAARGDRRADPGLPRGGVRGLRPHGADGAAGGRGAALAEWLGSPVRDARERSWAS
jgi:pimeloyl-ACP methyl ester carboxylesterase